MNNTELIAWLKWQYACEEAVGWLRDTGYSAAQAWRRCKRGDWMLWVACQLRVDRKTLVLAACDCAELAKAHWPKGDDRPAEALRVARAWANGDEGVTLDGVCKAAYAAYDAYDAASAHAAHAAYAAYDAAHASAAAYAAAFAAYESASAHAAYASAHAAAYDAATARSQTLAECATICRRYSPKVPLEEL